MPTPRVQSVLNSVWAPRVRSYIASLGGGIVPRANLGGAVQLPAEVKHLAGRTENQCEYIRLLEDGSVKVLVGLGATGTGKTLLAVQEGLRQLRAGKVSKLLLTRAAVTAGEELGHLPGSEVDKLQPFATPALDAVSKILGPGAWKLLLDRHVLELQSFAFMRGRTFDDAFIIADETQNNSFEQLKMLATRVGQNSKLCLLGDPTQSDCRANWRSALPAIEKLADLLQNEEKLAGMVDGDGSGGLSPELLRTYRCARFDADDVQRSAEAYVGLRLFEQLERESGARMFSAAAREAAGACD